MAENNKAIQLITELLIEKFGVEKLKRLLTGKMQIDIKPIALEQRRKAYVWDLKSNKTPFTEQDGHEIDADLLLIALEDAANILSHSNWHGDKFDRCSEVIIRYCSEHNIPLEFKAKKL
jgi:hypothetical protein